MTGYQPQDGETYRVTVEVKYRQGVDSSCDCIASPTVFDFDGKYGDVRIDPADVIRVEPVPTSELPTRVGSLIAAVVPAFAQLPVVLHLTVSMEGPRWIATATGEWIDPDLIERWGSLDGVIPDEAEVEST